MYTAQNAAIPDCQTQMLDDCSLHNSSCDECIGFSPDCFWCTLLPVSDNYVFTKGKAQTGMLYPAGKCYVQQHIVQYNAYLGEGGTG